MAATIDIDIDVSNHEQHTMTLDYAWYHTMGSVVHVFVLWLFGRTDHFRVAHAFGLFAMTMDWGLNYMCTGKRTIEFPEYEGNLDNGNEPLGNLQIFFFFVWFDYAAFNLMVWGLTLKQKLVTTNMFGNNKQALVTKMFGNNEKQSENDKQTTNGRTTSSWTMALFEFVFIPLMFWTAPLTAPLLNIDTRVAVLRRDSPKFAYVIATPIFVLLLRFVARLDWSYIGSTVMAGFGIGLVHHLPLFVFGMRGYSNLPALMFTLSTEWPAIFLGVNVMLYLGYGGATPSSTCSTSSHKKKNKNKNKNKNENNNKTKKKATTESNTHTDDDGDAEGDDDDDDQHRGVNVFTMCMWAMLLAIASPSFSKVEQTATSLVIYVPGPYMQSLGNTYLYTRTCLAPAVLPAVLREPQLDCFDATAGGGALGNNGSDMLVLAAAGKTGCMFSAHLLADFGSACGVCVSGATLDVAGWPGPPNEAPTQNSNVLFAYIYMPEWPAYVQRQGFGATPNDDSRVRCITFLKDPLARIISLFLYAHSGAEAWFRFQSGLMQELRASSNMTTAVDYFWQNGGEGYLLQSHAYLVQNLDRGCVAIRLEDVSKDFDESLAKIFRVWGVKEETIPALVKKAARHNMARVSTTDRQTNAHLTSDKFSNTFKTNVSTTLMATKTIRNLIMIQRRELGYE